MPTIPLNELLMLAAGLGVAGVAAGFLAGAFGIGGGAVIVPVADQALALMGYDPEIRMHVAVGTSLAVIVPTSIRSFLAHRARGAVDLALLRAWVVAVPAGVILATLVAAAISGDGLRLAFAGVATLVALRLLLGRPTWRLADDVPRGPVRAIVGGVIGFLSTLMGVGGGVMNNTFMTLCGRPIHQAVATSSGVGVLIAIPGALGYMAAGLGQPLLPPLSIGYVNLVGVALIVPLTIIVAPLGVKVAHALPGRALEIAFGLFLVVVALRFVLGLF